jgi:hypothetical protein
MARRRASDRERLGAGIAARRPGSHAHRSSRAAGQGAAEWQALLARLHEHAIPFSEADVPLSREQQVFVQLAPGVVIEFVTSLSSFIKLRGFPCLFHFWRSRSARLPSGRPSS